VVRVGEDRRVEVSPSQFAHEAEGLAIIRAIVPDETPILGLGRSLTSRDSQGLVHRRLAGGGRRTPGRRIEARRLLGSPPALTGNLFNRSVVARAVGDLDIALVDRTGAGLTFNGSARQTRVPQALVVRAFLASCPALVASAQLARDVAGRSPPGQASMWGRPWHRPD
jgi:hypothetical protein